MTWLIARLAPNGDEKEYLHDFELVTANPSRPQWTNVQTLAYRFGDRNQVTRFCDYLDASARPVRLVPRKPKGREARLVHHAREMSRALERLSKDGDGRAWPASWWYLDDALKAYDTPSDNEEPK